MSSRGPGQMASEARSAPVTCRQEVQWQEEPFRGRDEMGTGVVKDWAWQRHWALRVIVVSGVAVVVEDIVRFFSLVDLFFGDGVVWSMLV